MVCCISADIKEIVLSDKVILHQTDLNSCSKAYYSLLLLCFRKFVPKQKKIEINFEELASQFASKVTSGTIPKESEEQSS